MGGESSKFASNHVLRRHSTRSIRYVDPPAITIGNSKSCQDVAETANKIRDSLSVPEIVEYGRNSVQNSGCNSPAQRTNSIRRKNTLSIKMRQLIQSCFQNPHEVIGRKIAKRTSDQRHDFMTFYATLPQEQREEFEESIKMLLKKSVANIDFPDEINRLSEEFGSRLVALRASGFKPEFMTPLADAFIRECTYLDNAVHPRHLTSAAFTEFMSVIFSSVRNGYYAQMRKIRRASHSNSFNGKSSTASTSPTNSRFKRLSMDSSQNGFGQAPPSPAARGSSSRSISPGESLTDECFGFDNVYLCPPNATSFLPVSARSA